MSAPHPRETDERCALRAQLRGDPMIGTAFPAARVLLVEQPGPWGRRGLRDSHFDPVIAERVIRRAQDGGLRTQAIRRPGRVPPAQRRAWAIADTARESITWGTFGADAELLDIPLDGTDASGAPVATGGTDASGAPVATRAPVAAAAPDTATPLYLVCAHGSHDACCALRGRTVATALDAHRPGSVWETTHLGGDRFAANVLVLPSGLLYGHVPGTAAEAFVAAAEADQVLTGLLRGHVGHPPAVQAALAHAYDRLAILNRHDVRVVSAHGDAAQTVVRLATPYGEHDVTVVAERVEQAGLTCHNPGANWYVRYRPEALVPAALPSSGTL